MFPARLDHAPKLNQFFFLSKLMLNPIRTRLVAKAITSPSNLRNENTLNKQILKHAQFELHSKKSDKNSIKIILQFTQKKNISQLHIHLYKSLKFSL